MQMIEQRVRDETGHDLPEPRLVTGETEVANGSWLEIWQGSYLGRTVMMIAYNVLQTIGYYGFATWVPTLLLSQGINVTKSLEYTFVIAIANPIGALLGVAFADRFERKWQIAWSAIAIAVFGLLFSQQFNAVNIVLAGILVTLANNLQNNARHFQNQGYLHADLDD